jgi:tetratricopeptide (TPR) repeat protein
VQSYTLERLCLSGREALSSPESAPVNLTSTSLDEPARLQHALLQAQGNVLRAARLLGVSRSALRYRMRRYGIARPGREECLRLLETGGELEASRTVQTAPSAPSGWEQKLVAVLAIEYIWPEATAREPFHAILWTQAAHWEQRLLEQVQGFGGVVLQRSPSLILAAFGIPQTLEQLPQRAVQTALMLRHLDSETSGAGARPELRLAVHWGRLLVDGQASEPTAQLRAVGETLAWPIRLLGYASPGEILVSHEVERLLAGWYELHERQVPRTGQLSEQRAVYSVVGLRPQGSRLEMHGRRPLSRFVGREREMTTLHDLVTRVEEGRGQVVGIIGEPGVGKSRLSYEFVRSQVPQPWLHLETRAVSYGQATPYLPCIDLLKGYFQLNERDTISTICTRVTTVLQTLDVALSSTRAALLALLDVPVEDPQWHTLDPPQRRQQMFQAVKRLLLRESQKQPLLVVVENLHWLDTETQACLDSLVESLPTARILLLVTYRPEYQHGWGNKTYYTQLRLDPLSQAHAHALLDALLGDAVDLQPLKQRLIALTQGNPFFLEESVQTLLDTGDVVAELGGYRLVTPLQLLQVPATVHAVLAARIDRLPAEEKRLLQTAAVIGTEVPLPLLLAIAELSEAVLHGGLAHLQAAEFLYETHLFPEVEYTFKHALTHEVAYRSLPQERRRALHARIVEVLEACAGDRLADQVERLAAHAVRGEVWDKALDYCRQAGAKAMARSASREAVGFFEQALSTLPYLPEQRDTHEQAIDMRLALRSALQPSGDFGRILVYLHEAEALAVALDDPRRLGRVSHFLANLFTLRGAYEQAIAAAQRALALATASGEAVLQAQANVYLGFAYQDQGDYRQAADCLRHAVMFFEGTRRHERFGEVFLPAVYSRARLAWCHAELGTFAEGRVCGDEGLRIAEAVAHPASLMYASCGSGLLALRQGDLPGALALLERAMGLCQDVHLPLYFPWIAAALGTAYTLDGRFADAVPLLTQGLEQSAATARAYFETLCRLALGEARMLTGHLEEAHTLAERTLALTRTHQIRGYQVYALHLLGEIATRRDPPQSELAIAHYQQATSLAEALGMRPLQAHCHHSLGTLHARAGAWPQARAELSTAIKMYRSMHMTFWLPQAEAALAQIKRQ